MSTSSCTQIGGELERLQTADVTLLDVSGLRELLDTARRVKATAAGVEFAVARELRERHAAGTAPRPAVLLNQAVGKTEAGKVERRAELLEQLPAMAAVFDGGAITTAHIDAAEAAVRVTPGLVQHQAQLADAAARLGPDAFVEHAQRLAVLFSADGGVGEFERQRRDTSLRRWVQRSTGMHHFHGAFDPERGAEIHAVIDRLIEQQFHAGTDADLDNDQRAAVAMHQLFTSGGGGKVGASIGVLIDEQTLYDGVHQHTDIDVDGPGGRLPVETVRRTGCDAEIYPMVLDGEGVVTDMGRSRRLATPAQRRALWAMHRTCAVPGCTVRFSHCKIHHILWWRRRGRTDLTNMVPLCERHHHDAHEGGWQLALDQHRNVSWTGPPRPDTV